MDAAAAALDDVIRWGRWLEGHDGTSRRPGRIEDGPRFWKIWARAGRSLRRLGVTLRRTADGGWHLSETEDRTEHGRLLAKLNAHLLVRQRLRRPGAGFDRHDTPVLVRLGAARRLSHRQTSELDRRLRKYHRQLDPTLYRKAFGARRATTPAQRPGTTGQLPLALGA